MSGEREGDGEPLESDVGLDEQDAETSQDDAGAQQDDGGEDDVEEKATKAREAAEQAKRTQHAGQVRREKAKRLAAEARSAELEQRIADIERRTGGRTNEDELLALIGQLPDTEDDPVGDIATLKRALKLYRDREVQAHGQTQQQAAIEREVNKLRGAMIESEEDFAAEHADYYDAAKYYRQARTDELREAGYGGVHLDRKLADDLFGVVRMALESGQDPAERVYTLAGRRGFKPGMRAADKALDKLGAAAATGTRPVARQAGGSLTWGDVAKLDGAARDKAWAKLREREKARGRG
jgi:hypothetical protein